MRQLSRTFPIVTLIAVALAACVSSPTGPEVRLRPGLFFDGDPVPCDSTIITDGSCRGGYIIPWNLQGR
jgi:hypothetical protein